MDVFATRLPGGLNTTLQQQQQADSWPDMITRTMLKSQQEFTELMLYNEIASFVVNITSVWTKMLIVQKCAADLFGG
jgi:hypothetical protein